MYFAIICISFSLSIFNVNAKLLESYHGDTENQFYGTLIQRIVEIEERQRNEIDNLKNEFEALKSHLHGFLGNKLESFRSEITDLITNDMKNIRVKEGVYHNSTERIGNLKQELEQCRQQQELLAERKREIGPGIANQTNVAFQAGLSSELMDIATDQKIVFDVVTLNKGGAYDASTGIFTAFVKGTYVFFATIITAQDTQIRTAIVKNGIPLTYIHAPEVNQDYGSGSSMAVTPLEVGDRVWMKAIDDRNSGAIDNWSNFSGFILFSEFHWIPLN